FLAAWAALTTMLRGKTVALFPAWKHSPTLLAGFISRLSCYGRSRPNNSFKPNLLRSTNNMAGKACHVVGSATQVGLTQALGGLGKDAAARRSSHCALGRRPLRAG